MSFVNTYSEHFVLSTHDVTEKARQYARGLMQASSRKNMDRMAEVVPDATSRNLQQFLTHSTWDDRAVVDHVAHDVNNLIGDNQSTGLIIDESSFAKQGKISVGTFRQWLGRLGKTNNGQVAVFGAHANTRFVSPIDVRLYFPREWTNDPKRCDKAGIPKNKRKFHTKIELAGEKHLNYGWIGADAGYGKGPGFCIALDKMSEVLWSMLILIFLFLRKVLVRKFLRKNPRRGVLKKYRTDLSPKGVGEIVSSVPDSDWTVIDLRDSTRGRLKVRAGLIPYLLTFWAKKVDSALYLTLTIDLIARLSLLSPFSSS